MKVSRFTLIAGFVILGVFALVFWQRQAARGKGAATLMVLQQLNTKSIEFYGKVVDQYGEILPGVQVNGSVIYNTGLSSGVSNPRTVTDAAGRFEFHGLKGRTLDFNLLKPGYEFMPEGDAFDYTELVPEAQRHHPDPKNPVVLKMWKRQGAEPLIHREGDYKIPADGTPVRIDLMSGRKVGQGGDLIFVLKHESWVPGVPGKRPFPWTLEVQANDGGIVVSTQRLMYLAPEGGYQAELVIDEPADKQRWESTVDLSFYLKSRGQFYSHVGMWFNADPDVSRGSYLSMKWWLNSTPDHRNLEYDPYKAPIPQNK